MLVPAQLYKSEIIEVMYRTWHDERYKFYYDVDMHIPEFSDCPSHRRQFASVDKDGNLIGYISYSADYNPKRAFSFSIINFDFGNSAFLFDVRQAVADCFFKYGLNSIEWMCYADNPACKHYHWFVNYYGGRQSGYLRSAGLTCDGELRDVVLFEILRTDLMSVDADNRVSCKLAKATGYEIGDVL